MVQARAESASRRQREISEAKGMDISWSFKKRWK